MSLMWLLLVGWFLLSVPVCLVVGRSIATAKATLAAQEAAQQQPTNIARAAEAPSAA
jgi:hypothetical protein